MVAMVTTLLCRSVRLVRHSRLSIRRDFQRPPVLLSLNGKHFVKLVNQLLYELMNLSIEEMVKFNELRK